MKKKVLAVLLGGCMVAGMLAGCGGGGDDARHLMMEARIPERAADITSKLL